MRRYFSKWARILGYILLAAAIIGALFIWNNKAIAPQKNTPDDVMITSPSPSSADTMK